MLLILFIGTVIGILIAGYFWNPKLRIKIQDLLGWSNKKEKK